MSQARYLVVFEGSSSRRVALPEHGQITIGRGETCQVRLTDGSISRVHASLDADSHGVRLSDLGSHNGTLLNGEPVAGARTLASGDVLTLVGVSLVLHAPPHRFPTEPLRDPASFRRRLDEELERAVRYHRPLAVCALVFEAAPDRTRITPDLSRWFRRMDSATWLSDNELVVAMPETDEAGARDLGRRALGGFPNATVRAGLAFCPKDGIALDALVGSAREAARQVDAHQIGDASETYKRLVAGDQMIIVADPAMVRLYDLVERLARTEQPVLVSGEPGTGKALAAQALHHWSSRVLERLVTVKCGTLPDDMADSELFGYEKGTFTGAAASGAGVLEATDGGTVFLDDLEALSPRMQEKLLRFLQTKTVVRAGDNRARPVDVRVVAATSADLGAEVRAGAFRLDLHELLARAMLWFAPLRERPREVPLLARAFLQEQAVRLKKRLAFAPAAMQRVHEHPWPGNVHELEAFVGTVALATKGEVVELAHVEAVLGKRRQST